jgi:hypothetical protein
MQGSKSFEYSYKAKAYFVFGAAMYLFFYRLISSSMLSQMNRPPFLFAEKEWAYRLLLQSHIPQYITSHSFLAALLDVSLLITTIGFLLSLKRIFLIIFTGLCLFYFFTYNMVTGHHYHGLAGLIVITFTFWFQKEEKFNLAWEGARYYLLYIFSSAALWKIFRGSVFYQLQLSDILKSQQIDLLIQNPQTIKAHCVGYLIAHPETAHIILLANVLVQLSFLAGFFTRKFDSFLFVLAIIFCIANYYVMSILSAELLILNLTLLHWDKIEAYLKRKEILVGNIGN